MAASAIRTGADTSREGCRSGCRAACAAATGRCSGEDPDPPAPDPPAPVTASTAQHIANPAAVARREPRTARRTRPPPRTLRGAKSGIPRGAGGAGRVSGTEGNTGHHHLP
ncbi:hypothetical protein GCM10010327_33910 [Streptomyces nitrosporeus]|nr:hypothetical protein GCM10010327_33910 [Streptomyces nitrosporeus]